MTRLSRRLQFPLFLLACLFFAGCGGGNGSTSPQQSSSPQQIPSAQLAAQLAQQGYLKALNASIGEQFGYNVALSGDTLVVGAPNEASCATGINGDQTNNGCLNSGAVYVFTQTNGVWTQQAYVKASNTGSGVRFGHSVALSGDTLAVGAPSEPSNATGVDGNQADNSALNSGAVYVFTRTNGVWTQRAYMKASNTDAGDLFGSFVAVSGDTLAVGAAGEASCATGINGDQANNGCDFAGAVYVFTRTNGIWTQQAYVKASNTDKGDWFGINLALAGDTLAVSAVLEASCATGINGDQTNNGCLNAGAAYVFTRTSGAWTQQAYLKASNTDAEDQFAGQLALAGDTIVIGARFEASAATGVNGNQTDNSAINSGAAYVFTRTGGVWTQEAYLKASNAGPNKNFAGSVAIAGDMEDILAVGARLEDSNATGINGDQTNSNSSDSGAAYVFTRMNGVWTQQAYVKASNTDAGDQFGLTVALSGNTLAVGAPFEASSSIGANGNQADNSAPNSGAVYVFSIGLQ